MRGNLPDAVDGLGLPGSIPARAGEPRTAAAWESLTRVYPRTCEGTHARPYAYSVAEGLSPHVRGNHDHLLAWFDLLGSIPARAGEPPQHPVGHCPEEVYPRTCGETTHPFILPAKTTGLSPHVRGNPRRGREGPGRPGSIPARAGEPSGRRPRSRRSRVYPRTCGGTGTFGLMGNFKPGLSPHVRGNRSYRPVHESV